MNHIEIDYKKNSLSFDSLNLSMKHVITLAIFLILIATQIPNASAHSPSSMELEYDSENQILGVSITHNVSDPSNHYVDKVEVTKNGVTAISEEYDNQPSNSTFSYDYIISTVENNSIEVTAYCSISGEITQTLDFSGSNGAPEDSNGGVIPWSLVVGAIVVLIIIIAGAAVYSRE